MKTLLNHFPERKIEMEWSGFKFTSRLFLVVALIYQHSTFAWVTLTSLVSNPARQRADTQQRNSWTTTTKTTKHLLAYPPEQPEIGANSNDLQILPIQIHLSDVSVEYRSPWTRRLFSAMPRIRPTALTNITWSLNDPQLVLLTGDSTAGKSTLLQVLAKGLESPIFEDAQGTLLLSCLNKDNNTTHSPRPHAIYLDASVDTPKYDDFYHSATRKKEKTSFSDLIVLKLLSRSGNPNRASSSASSFSPRQEHCRQLVDQILPFFLNLDEREYALSGKTWSQSLTYRMRLLEAAVESMWMGACIPSRREEADVENQMDRSFIAPAPLLLLDEWLDKETSVVIQNVQASLEAVVEQTGAIVIAVTHKPERWKLSTSHSTTSRVILSRGKLVT